MTTGAHVDANTAGHADGWPVNDVSGLARSVPELDPARYVDEQARIAFEEALVKWPVMGRLMGLVGGER